MWIVWTLCPISGTWKVGLQHGRHVWTPIVPKQSIQISTQIYLDYKEFLTGHEIVWIEYEYETACPPPPPSTNAPFWHLHETHWTFSKLQCKPICGKLWSWEHLMSYKECWVGGKGVGQVKQTWTLTQETLFGSCVKPKCCFKIRNLHRYLT